MIKAFPSVISIHNGRQEYPGMELRDYFAGKALTLAIQQLKDYYSIDPKYVAKWCYEMADAMIKAREQHDGMEEKTSVSKD
jgi:hypothetical protein